MSALESGPATLAQLVSSTHLARPTAHRIAVALEYHRLVSRDSQGRFILGPRLSELASAAGEDHLLAAAGPLLAAWRDKTHESSQLYRRQGDVRICVANAERPIGLRDSIPVGATMSMQGGSAAQVLLAWEEPDRLHRGLIGARFNATMLSAVRRRGWAQSVGEREPGVASVSAPVRGTSGKVIAAVFTAGSSWLRRAACPRCSATTTSPDESRHALRPLRLLRPLRSSSPRCSARPDPAGPDAVAGRTLSAPRAERWLCDRHSHSSPSPWPTRTGVPRCGCAP